MSEEQLNNQYIANKTGLIENDELIPIIRKMLSEAYINGLRQKEFELNMELLEENMKLKKRIDNIKSHYETEIESNKYINDEYKRLKKQLDIYENPEDMTLMFMWCDEKAKDEIKRLKKQNEFLMKRENTLQSLEQYLENMWSETQDVWFVKLINKIKEWEENND